MRRIVAAATAATLLVTAPSAAAPAQADSDPQLPVETAPILDSMADWIVGRADGTDRNGLMRKLPWVYGPGLNTPCTKDRPCLDVDVKQSTAACSSLEFLSMYYPARAESQKRSVSSEEISMINEFATQVLAFRVDPTPDTEDLFDGAVASTPEARPLTYSSFGNAMCGQALLAAHDVTGEPGYLRTAEDIADFLVRMQDPSEFYANHSVRPFVDEDGSTATAPGGFFDQVSSLNNTQATMSTWNMLAVDFLSDLAARINSEEYAKSASRGRAFYSDALELGVDWYTVRFDSPVTLRNRVFVSRANAANCQDNHWHRKGSCVLDGELPVGGTLGTDMMEYGLANQFRYDRRVHSLNYAIEHSKDIYWRFAKLPGVHTRSANDPPDCVDDSLAGPVAPYYPPDNTGSSPSGRAWDWDPHLSFGGYFRSNDTKLVSSEAKYYDIVGFGVLAEVRMHLVPERFRHAALRFVHSNELAALLYRDLTPMALPGLDRSDVDHDADTREPVCILTEGTLPIAHNGIGLLQTLGYVTERHLDRRRVAVNRPGMSGDFELWDGWSHVRHHELALPG